MNDPSVFLGIAVISLVTILLRALPFLVFSSKEKTPAMVTYLGKVLPYAIMGMLVVYCLKGVDLLGESHGLPELIAVAVTAALHLWRRNTLLSIGAGTAVYMVLVQLVF